MEAKIEVNSSQATSQEKQKRFALSDSQFALLLILPAMIVIGIFALFPLAYAINLAFRSADLTSAQGIGGFVGLDNFYFVLNDKFFWQSTGRTLIFAAGAVTTEMILGLAVALLFNDLRWFQGIIRSIFILPLAASPLAIGLIWRYMYHADFGVYNAIVSAVGLPEQNWLGNTSLAMPSVILFDVWQWTPFVTLILLAGLQSIPSEAYEAAQIDGASSWQTLQYVILPMLRPVLLLVLVLRITDAVRLYDAVFALTAGGPGTATEVLTFYIYRNGLRFFKLDIASAMSLLFLYATVVFSTLLLRRLVQDQVARAHKTG